MLENHFQPQNQLCRRIS